MYCLICYETNNLIKICKCNYYVHDKCYQKWILDNDNKCFYCKKKISESIYKKFLRKIKYIYYIYSILSQYDLHSGIKWDELCD